jgi:hypothetical protein
VGDIVYSKNHSMINFIRKSKNLKKILSNEDVFKKILNIESTNIIIKNYLKNWTIIIKLINSI